MIMSNEPLDRNALIEEVRTILGNFVGMTKNECDAEISKIYEDPEMTPAHEIAFETLHRAFKSGNPSTLIITI
jgi:hypothetical protein